jgi:hypothetical protein
VQVRSLHWCSYYYWVWLNSVRGDAEIALASDAARALMNLAQNQDNQVKIAAADAIPPPASSAAER